MVTATEDDFAAEYLTLDMSAAVVPDLEAAIAHIRKYSSGHTEAIVTRDLEAARHFTAAVDSAAVMVNASTRFTDGGEFGFGAEIGISTQKLHARGPMGLPEMTSTKYIVTGNGHTLTRPRSTSGATRTPSGSAPRQPGSRSRAPSSRSGLRSLPRTRAPAIC